MAETNDGMTVIHDLANRFHILTAHSGDPMEEGQRSVVTYMLQMANFTEEDFLHLNRAEAQTEEQR